MAVQGTDERYAIAATQGVIARLREILADINLRLTRSEARDGVLDAAALEISNQGVRYIESVIAPRAAELETLLADYRLGVPAGAVVEGVDRLFLTAARTAAIEAAVRGGVDAAGDTLAKLYALVMLRATSADLTAAIAGVKGTADAAHDTLGELAALVDANTAAVATKADAAATTTALGSRLRLDAAGGYSAVQQAHGRANLDADNAYNRRRNRLIDPGMRVSQERGNNLITMASGVVVYPCDGMACARSGATGGVQVQRVQSITPAGSANRVRFTVTGANATPAAGDYLLACFPVEGQEITDLRFGSVGAKMMLYRVTLRMPVACKLNFSVRNSNNSVTRSYVGTLEILPGEVGLDVTKYIVVPGDTSGSWSTDNSLGASITLGFLAGSNYQGAAGWQAGNFFGLAANSNMMATTGWSFDVMDTGWYDVSDITNPVPPRFELKSFGEDFRDCLRFYEKTYDTETLPGSVTYNGAICKVIEGTVSYATVNWDFTEKRDSPTLVTYNPATGASGQGYNTNMTLSYASYTGYSGKKRASFFANNTSMTGGSTVTQHAVAIARMI